MTSYQHSLTASNLWLTYEDSGYWITLKGWRVSTEGTNAHGGQSCAASSGFSHTHSHTHTHTHTHTCFPLSPPPPLPNAVLDYCGRIWIYLRQAPIKLQMGDLWGLIRSPITLLGLGGEILPSVVGSTTMHKTRGVRSLNGRQAHVLCMCLLSFLDHQTWGCVWSLQKNVLLVKQDQWNGSILSFYYFSWLL